MKELFGHIYEGKKVFITGHSGFKGAWLALWLTQLGAQVKGFALPPSTQPNLFDGLALASTMHSLFADVRDLPRLQAEMTSFAPDFVFHLAAQPLVRQSYQTPAETFHINALGSVNVLEAVRNTPSVRAVINVTTDKCYQNNSTLRPYQETDPLGGYDPYSASKAMSELVTSSYRNSFFNPKDYGSTHHVALASARAGNVIGGGDWAPDRLVPDFIRALLEGKTISLRCPAAVRPWQHVLEPLSGYLWLGAQLWNGPSAAQAWNFGPEADHSVPVEEIVKGLIACFKKGAYTIQSVCTVHEEALLRLDISKAKEQLRWHPMWNLQKTLHHTASWYKEVHNGAPMLPLTLQQLNEYIADAKKQNAAWS